MGSVPRSGPPLSTWRGWLDLRRLELDVFTDNDLAVALCRKFGFEVEGTLRACAPRDGCLIDASAMARLLDRPSLRLGTHERPLLRAN